MGFYQDDEQEERRERAQNDVLWACLYFAIELLCGADTVIEPVSWSRYLPVHYLFKCSSPTSSCRRSTSTYSTALLTLISTMRYNAWGEWLWSFHGAWYERRNRNPNKTTHNKLKS